MKNIVLTNKRIFIWFSDLKIVIPLKNLQKYETAKWDSGIKVEYIDNGAIQTFRLANTWLLPNVVNNALNKHKNEILTAEELVISSNLRPTIDATYGVINETSDNNSIPLLTPTSNKTNPVIIQKPKANYAGLIVVCLFVLFIGGCVYLIEKSDKTNNISKITNTTLGTTGNSAVNTNDDNSVRNYLTSKTFKYDADNMSIKFYPEGNYELSHNYKVVLTGSWLISGGNSSSIMVHLASNAGDLYMTLSSSGTITDNSTSRTFQ